MITEKHYSTAGKYSISFDGDLYLVSDDETGKEVIKGSYESLIDWAYTPESIFDYHDLGYILSRLHILWVRDN